MDQIMHGKIITQYHRNQQYTTIFNQNTGLFIRKEDKNVQEPFWAEDGPELLDVSITTYCERECPFCYRKSNREGYHISLDDLKKIVSQAKEIGVLQIAIGGGNPNQHPDFIEILRYIRDNGIVPSYTTNGEGLSDEILEATKMYCGAMAISVYAPYNESAYLELVNRAKYFGVKVNLHIILTTDTICQIIKWLKNPPQFFYNSNAIIFLNYKNVGGDLDLSIRDAALWKEFFYAVEHSSNLTIGFDSCTVPGIVSYMDGISPSLIEPCEAGRFSAFISEDLEVFPCSFLANTDCGISLRNHTLLDIWKNADLFISMRERVRENNCKNCMHEYLCHGGCHFFPINNCLRNYTP